MAEARSASAAESWGSGTGGVSMRVSGCSVAAALRAAASLPDGPAPPPAPQRRAHGLHARDRRGWLSRCDTGLWPAAMALTQAALGAELRRDPRSVPLGDVLVFSRCAASALRHPQVRWRRRILSESRARAAARAWKCHYFLPCGLLLALAALAWISRRPIWRARPVGIARAAELVNNSSPVAHPVRAKIRGTPSRSATPRQVQQVGMRACTVRTWGAEVIAQRESHPTR
jgi:hypothetical protein